MWDTTNNQCEVLNPANDFRCLKDKHDKGRHVGYFPTETWKESYLTIYSSLVANDETRERLKPQD